MGTQVVNWLDHLGDLGKLSDGELGKKLGVSRQRVHQVRQIYKISPLNHKNVCVWSDEKIRMLGTMPDGELGKILSLDRVTIFLKRKSLGIASFKRPIPHGTLNGYKVRKCRCSRCRAANAAKQDRYRKSRAKK